MTLPFLVKNLRLNSDSPQDLECKDKPGLKICTIPVNHFLSKESGNYYTYHLNHLNEYSIYYDANPINIILPPSIEIKIEDEYNIDEIIIGRNGT